MTVVEQHDHSESLGAAQGSMLPKEALSFTVDETLLKDMASEAFQARGLLRLMESRVKGGWETHIELLFARKDDFEPKNKWEIDFISEPKIKIYFYQIESVTFKRKLVLLEPNLIIKLEPEQSVSDLKVDPIVREIVLHLSWRDAQLAKRLQAAIMMYKSTYA